MNRILLCLSFIIFHLSFSPVVAQNLSFSPVGAQEAQTMREAFKAMPDSLMPYLTTNNRLDLMDFMDAKMKAAVTNLLEGQTEMTFLSDDSLSLRMSDALTIEMKTQKVDTTTVVDFKRIYFTRSGERQVVLTRYDARTWHELSPAIVIESTLPKFDEKVKPDKIQ